MWSSDVECDSLIHLQLPPDVRATGSWLKDLAAKHPLLQHLSLSTPSHLSITTDACEKPFDDFAHLESLSLKMDESVNDYSHDCHRSIGAILDRLPIKSLQLSGFRLWSYSIRKEEDELSARLESLIPSRVTTPNLIEALCHLRINSSVDERSAEYLLYHCRNLKTLRLDEICSLDVGYPPPIECPPLITSPSQMPPFLRSVTFGFAVGEWEQWVS